MIVKGQGTVGRNFGIKFGRERFEKRLDSVNRTRACLRCLLRDLAKDVWLGDKRSGFRPFGFGHDKRSETAPRAKLACRNAVGGD